MWYGVCSASDNTHVRQYRLVSAFPRAQGRKKEQVIMDPSHRGLWAAGVMLLVCIAVAAVHSVIAAAAVGAASMMVYCLAEVGWQLFKDARWLMRWMRGLWRRS